MQRLDSIDPVLVDGMASLDNRDKIMDFMSKFITTMQKNLYVNAIKSRRFPSINLRDSFTVRLLHSILIFW